MDILLSLIIDPLYKSGRGGDIAWSLASLLKQSALQQSVSQEYMNLVSTYYLHIGNVQKISEKFSQCTAQTTQLYTVMLFITNKKKMQRTQSMNMHWVWW